MKITLTPQDDASLITSLPWRDFDTLRLEREVLQYTDYIRLDGAWREVGWSRITGSGGVASSYPMGRPDYSDRPPVVPSWEEVGRPW